MKLYYWNLKILWNVAPKLVTHEPFFFSYNVVNPSNTQVVLLVAISKWFISQFCTVLSESTTALCIYCAVNTGKSEKKKKSRQKYIAFISLLSFHNFCNYRIVLYWEVQDNTLFIVCLSSHRITDNFLSSTEEYWSLSPWWLLRNVFTLKYLQSYVCIKYNCNSYIINSFAT